jgi:aryl-alcohol dehydrogenase-like predicted oxidoreductase
MEKIKKNGLAKNIGISVYETKELVATWNIWQPNVVQLPINVIDRRFLIEGWINKLCKNDIEIHARSIFLQGVLLNKNFAKRKFGNNNLLNTFFEWCFKKNIQPLEACINFVKYLKVNRIIIGIDSHKQLLNLYNYFKICDRIMFTRKIASNNLNLIDPRKW